MDNGLATIDGHRLVSATGGIQFHRAQSILEKRFPTLALPLDVWTDLRRHLIWTPEDKVLDWNKLSGHVENWAQLVKDKGFHAARQHVNQQWSEILK